jgi:hypothetical protein
MDLLNNCSFGTQAPAFRGRWSRTVLLTATFLALAGCGEDTGDEDRTAPAAPRMLIKTCGEELTDWPERGADAEAGSAGIRIEWEMTEATPDLAGFEVFRSYHPDSEFVYMPEDPESFLEGTSDFYSWLDTSEGTQPLTVWGMRYFYFVRALDDSGNRSQPSDTTSYRLWDPPRVFSSGVGVADSMLSVAWQYEYVDYQTRGFRGFELLIASADRQQLLHRELVQLNLQPGMVVELDQRELGLESGSYLVRVDTVVEHVEQYDSLRVAIPSNPNGCALSGSESNWISFTF